MAISVALLLAAILRVEADGAHENSCPAGHYYPSATCLPFADRDQHLIAAAKAGDTARVESLLKKGADVNVREQNGQLVCRILSRSV
jgi:ankyrin repeat protein